MMEKSIGVQGEQATDVSLREIVAPPFSTKEASGYHFVVGVRRGYLLGRFSWTDIHLPHDNTGESRTSRPTHDSGGDNADGHHWNPDNRGGD